MLELDETEHEPEVGPFWCHGKQRFKTFEHAHRIAKRCRNSRTAQNYSAYRCRTCGDYHIGTSIMKRKHPR